MSRGEVGWICSHKKIPYNVQHEVKPLELPKDMAVALETLLLYMPSIDSTQAVRCKKFEENGYGKTALKNLLKGLGFYYENDVKLESNEKTIPKDHVELFEKNVCPICQKFEGIVTSNKRTKEKRAPLDCFLYHIRNSLAHGNFFVHGDMLIGYDYDSMKEGENRTSLYRIRPVPLVERFQEIYGAILAIPSEEVREAEVATTIFANLFEDFGYSVNRMDMGADFVAEKNGTRYFVEYKSYGEVRYLHPENMRKGGKSDLSKFSRIAQEFKENEWLLVVVDSSRSTKSVDYALDKEEYGDKVVVLDKPVVTRILEDEENLDAVLDEIVRKRRDSSKKNRKTAILASR